MKNLIGQKFNKLLVLEKTSQREGGSIVWKCSRVTQVWLKRTDC